MNAVFFVVTLVFAGQLSFAQTICDSPVESTANSIADYWNSVKSTILSKSVSKPLTTTAGISWSVPGNINGDQINVRLDIPCTNTGKNDDCRVNYFWLDDAKMQKPNVPGVAASLWGKGSYSSFCNVDVTQDASPGIGLAAGKCSCTVLTDQFVIGADGKPVYGDYNVNFKLVAVGSSTQLRTMMLGYTGGIPPYETIETTCTGSIKSHNGEEACGSHDLAHEMAEVCDKHLDGIGLLLKEDLSKISPQVSCH